jgi:Haem-binding uptake, Tiki superfamily, ChaN
MVLCRTVVALMLLSVPPDLARSQPIALPRSVSFEHVDQPPETLVRALSAFRLITVGELHGSKESPEFVAGLVEGLIHRGRHVVLGLEMLSSDQAALDAYLHGDSSALCRMRFLMRYHLDGRSSVALVGLLSRLRALPGVTVVAFDSGQEQNERDSLMAVLFLRRFATARGDVGVVLAGNVHAAVDSTAAMFMEMFKHPYHSMGARLLATPGSPFARANAVAIYESARGGAFWNCQFDEQTRERCGVHRVTGQERSEAGSAYRFSVETPPSGYDASFIVQTATPAFPFLYSPAGRRCEASAAP